VPAVTAVLLILLAGSFVYSLLSILAAFQYLSVPLPGLASPEPISILKPAFGLDLGLESNLRTFFEQDYPAFEILFAVRTSNDPAVEVVETLQPEYPRIPVRLLATGDSPFPNAKVYSLTLMLAAAKNDLVVMSDSDHARDAEHALHGGCRVSEPSCGRSYLPYRAAPGPSFWSRLAAVGMNTDFIAARMLEGLRFAVGPTIVARRRIVQGMGGVERLKDLSPKILS
jgi:ceramide glucosyltransferase